MKQIKKILIIALISSLLSIVTGCRTIHEPKYKPIKDTEIRLKHAKHERKTFTRLLENAKSVDDAIKAREHLEKNQILIEELEAGKKIKDDVDDGFKSTTERTVVYGPIGWVLVGSKWVIEKLYIIYPWNWRAF